MEIIKKHKFSVGALAKKCLPATIAFIPLTVVPSVAQAMITIAVSSTSALHFGTFSAGTTGGTVSISTVGVRTKTGSVTLLAGAGLETQGILSISGSTGVLIDVSMTAATFSVTGPGPAMNVGTFDINGGGSSVSVTLTTNPASFPLGATITVAAAPGQTDGVYSGTYTVMANYQ